MSFLKAKSVASSSDMRCERGGAEAHAPRSLERYVRAFTRARAGGIAAQCGSLRGTEALPTAAIARSCLPTPSELEEIAAELNLAVLPASECVKDGTVGGAPHTLEGDDFYLVALQKPTA